MLNKLIGHLRARDHNCLNNTIRERREGLGETGLAFDRLSSVLDSSDGDLCCVFSRRRALGE